MIGIIGSPDSMNCRWDSWNQSRKIGKLCGQEYIFIDPGHHPFKYAGMVFDAIIMNEEPRFDPCYMGQDCPVNAALYYASRIRRSE